MKLLTCKTSALFLLALAPVAGGCGSSSQSASSGNGGCAMNQLQVLFNPMFTAYDGMHPFKVPAIVDNIDPNAVTWSLSDPSMADLVQDATLGGVMIAPRKAGVVTVVATAGTMCGTSLLTITQAVPDDWATGNMRYNNGIVLTGGLRNQNPDAAPMKDIACTNCHGDTATNGQFHTVSHTPQQTGGFSDDDLLSIFTKGKVPVGGYFDTTVVNYNAWQGFHSWQMSPQESKGIIVYLRSLTPQAQAGMRGDFGRGGGGGGGGRRNDGGMGGGGNPPPPDAGAATD